MVDHVPFISTRNIDDTVAPSALSDVRVRRENMRGCVGERAQRASGGCHVFHAIGVVAPSKSRVSCVSASAIKVAIRGKGFPLWIYAPADTVQVVIHSIPLGHARCLDIVWWGELYVISFE